MAVRLGWAEMHKRYVGHTYRGHLHDPKGPMLTVKAIDVNLGGDIVTNHRRDGIRVWPQQDWLRFVHSAKQLLKKRGRR